MEKIWKPIPEYEGLYEVNNLGIVKNVKKNKILLKSKINGYYKVGLAKDGIRKTFLVHQLVAIAFLNHKPCGHKLVVDHINGFITDNRVSNLQIVTQRENVYKHQGGYSSKFKGVVKTKYNKFISRITINGKKIHLGTFNSEEEASQAYQNKLKEIEL